MATKKQARPPPDDPAQSERFMKDAAELMSADGAQLYERAMETLIQPAKLPVQTRKPIIETAKTRKKKPAGTDQR